MPASVLSTCDLVTVTYLTEDSRRRKGEIYVQRSSSRGIQDDYPVALIPRMVIALPRCSLQAQ